MLIKKGRLYARSSLFKHMTIGLEHMVIIDGLAGGQPGEDVRLIKGDRLYAQGSLFVLDMNCGHQGGKGMQAQAHGYPCQYQQRYRIDVAANRLGET